MSLTRGLLVCPNSRGACSDGLVTERCRTQRRSRCDSLVTYDVSNLRSIYKLVTSEDSDSKMKGGITASLAAQTIIIWTRLDSRKANSSGEPVRPRSLQNEQGL